ncbi:hypothetical protein MTO96_035485 [Rhipicephalus appendiculatus]
MATGNVQHEEYSRRPNETAWQIRVPPAGTYSKNELIRHQHRRLLLTLEESGLLDHGLKKRFPPCTHCGSRVSFEIPFSSCMFVLLAGFSLSLLAFCAELAYNRYPRCRDHGPLFVKRHTTPLIKGTTPVILVPGVFNCRNATAEIDTFSLSTPSMAPIVDLGVA